MRTVCRFYELYVTLPDDWLFTGEVDSLLNVDGNRTPVQAYNLRYDFTPPEYVTALITESAIIPTTSAPVVLRVYQQDDL